MKAKYYISYGEAVYGPFATRSDAYTHAKTQGWFSFDIHDNEADALEAVEVECDR